INPRKRFNLPFDGFSVWDLEQKTVIDPKEFVSKGKATPFAGRMVYGVNYLTVKGGKIVYEKQ
ncbi:MAG: dihydroorotase, partial [Clostridia bacterium]|nr:dihydroorotase [Clostridia bacterium]